jgi:hypothetical protein
MGGLIAEPGQRMLVCVKRWPQGSMFAVLAVDGAALARASADPALPCYPGRDQLADGLWVWEGEALRAGPDDDRPEWFGRYREADLGDLAAAGFPPPLPPGARAVAIGELVLGSEATLAASRAKWARKARQLPPGPTRELARLIHTLVASGDERSVRLGLMVDLMGVMCRAGHGPQLHGHLMALAHLWGLVQPVPDAEGANDA